MSNKQQRSSWSKFQLQTRYFFRSYPAFPYVLKWLSICIIIGILVGSASAGFLQSLDWVSNLRDENNWIIIFLPLVGFAIGCLYFYFGKSVEPGNNLLLDTIHNPGNTIPIKMAPFVYIGTILTHLFGGSAGREGTALQMAGAIADQFSKPFRLNKEERRILIISAVAAGFGSVFGTPLAGAIFGLEFFLLGRLKYDAIFPAFTAAIIADIVTKLWNTPHTEYNIALAPEITLLNLFYAICAGVAFGICAAGFSKLIRLCGRLFKISIGYAPLRPFIGGLVIIAGVWLIGTTKYIGLGVPVIVDSFEQQLPSYDFALKVLFTVVTLSAGFKGGEVTPLFFIGATLGNALALFIPLPISLLAGMGFVAVFAGATNTPLACTIMAMELFGADCAVYVAISCVVAYLFSGNTGIYGRQMIGEPKHIRFKAFAGKSISDL